MPKLPIMPGRVVIAVLERLGFRFVRQRGSHVVLRRNTTATDVCVVPVHREVAVGTLRSVLRQAGVTPDDFLTAFMSKVKKSK